MNKLLDDHREREIFQEALLSWFKAHKRTLPWRKNNDWYPVFLSEFLLQQTQVSQALPYFEKFMRLYPTVSHLASAGEDELLKHWAGLGYYTRARNLRKAAQVIVTRFNGQFPQNLKDALQLPGIGPYTAAAVLSIAFNKPHAVVDGNVIRVITRLFNISDDIRTTKARNNVRELARHILAPQSAGSFNEAMMELGALICQPQTPQCAQCPLQHWCVARQKNNVTRIPFKSPARPRKNRFQFVFLFVHDDRLLLLKRPGRGLLAGMWEFPVQETDAEQFTKEISNILDERLSAFGIKTAHPIPPLRHIYSHIALQYRPLLIPVNRFLQYDDAFYVNQKWLPFGELNSAGLHQAHKKILNLAQFKDWWQRRKEWSGKKR